MLVIVTPYFYFFQTFMAELANREVDLEECLKLGGDILKQCHPDAVTTVKHWLTILQARWEEVTNWGLEREKKLKVCNKLKL